MKIQPLSNNVLIKIESQDKTKEGIYLPETAHKDRPGEGVVEAVGEVKEIKVGDRVLFVKHGHYEIKDKIIINEEDILAKIL